MTRRPMSTENPVLDALGQPAQHAFVLRARDDRNKLRWYIVHWTPNRQMVRILTSYPDKGAAERAITIMGYRLVPTPTGQTLADGFPTEQVQS